MITSKALPTIGQCLKSRGLLLLTILLLACPVYSSTDLPELGSSADLVLSNEEERQLISEFRNYIQNSLKLVDDPLSNDYIQRLGEKLAAQINSQQKFTFFIVDDPSINAFAGPGGYIGIHTGLIYASKTEDELASVLAHEIAHITQRHLFRSMDSASKMTWPTMLAILAAMVVGGNNGDVGNAVIASTVAGTSQNQLTYSRAYEQEADRIGIQLLAQAGFDPKAMPAFFKTLQQNHQYSETGLPEFLRTHPITTSRIADTESRAEQLTVATPNDQMNYLLTTSRLYYSNPGNTKKLSYKNKMKNPSTPKALSLVAKYQQALIHLQNENYSKARDHMKNLMKLDRVRLPYFITQAEIEYKQQEYNNTIQILEAAQLFYPNSLSVVSLYATALMESGKIETALETLNKQSRLFPENAAIHKLKADAATRLARTAEAFEALADYYLLTGQIHSAIKHMQMALDDKNIGRIEVLRLDAKLKRIKESLSNKRTQTKENP